MTEIMRRLRIAWLVSWVAGFFVGQWAILQGGWAGAFVNVFLGWRILFAILAYVALMFLIDAIWRSPSASHGRPLVREFVDAAILGAFVGLTIAK
jgi:hypothetical protein